MQNFINIACIVYEMKKSDGQICLCAYFRDCLQRTHKTEIYDRCFENKSFSYLKALKEIRPTMALN
jgi:hypothetical protein